MFSYFISGGVPQNMKEIGKMFLHTVEKNLEASKRFLEVEDLEGDSEELQDFEVEVAESTILRDQIERKMKLKMGKNKKIQL